MVTRCRPDAAAAPTAAPRRRGISPSAAPPASGPRPTLAERCTAACHERRRAGAFLLRGTRVIRTNRDEVSWRATSRCGTRCASGGAPAGWTGHGREIRERAAVGAMRRTPGRMPRTFPSTRHPDPGASADESRSRSEARQRGLWTGCGRSGETRPQVCGGRAGGCGTLVDDETEYGSPRTVDSDFFVQRLWTERISTRPAGTVPMWVMSRRTGRRTRSRSAAADAGAAR